MYRNPAEPVSESAVSPWMASILMRRGGNALQRFVLTYHQLAAMPRRWRRQLRRKMSVGLGSAALVLALAGPIVAAPARQPAAPDATIVVVNGEVANVNNNKCGLIEAILNARTSNANGMRPDCASGNVNGLDTISLPTNGEFVLTSAHNEQFGPTGLPVITSAVTIDGHGATIRRADGDTVPAFRILAVDNAGNLTLRNVTISNGDVRASTDNGGGVLNKNVLIVEGSAFIANLAYSGGAIFSDEGSTTTIVDSSLTGNMADTWERVYNYDNPGGGIFAAGDVTISNSLISGNEGSEGGGIALDSSTGQSVATVTGSTIANNIASREYGGKGGGIWIGANTQATITGSTIADNIAKGGLYGGGYGGGLFVAGQATLSGSTIDGNQVTNGWDCDDGYCFEYYLGHGGGIVNRGQTVAANTTISGNDEAVFTSGNLDVLQSTVTGNGGGIRVKGDTVTTLRGSVVSGNGFEVYLDNDDSVHSPTVVVNAFNVFGHSGNSGLVGLSKGATDMVPTVGLNAILGPLADNGGPTQTHALPAGSPALDRAPNASCTAAPVNGVDQRGQPRNHNAVGIVTNNECDVGAFERAGSAAAMGFYLSATGNGSVGGLAFTPGDIIKFTPAGGWAMHFDASDVGITKNVTAFEIEGNGNILLSLAAPQAVPGVGNVAAQDVLRFTPTSTGNTTAGSFTKAFDGSDNLLSTAGEKIDALGLNSSGHLALSTVGAAAVKTPQNTVLKAQDEDALGFNLSTSDWFDLFNGTAIPGLKAEDVNALWIDPDTGDLYISVVGAFNLGGVAGNGRDIVKLTFDVNAPNQFTPSLFWDGSANGFPTNIDGLEMIP